MSTETYRAVTTLTRKNNWQTVLSEQEGLLLIKCLHTSYIAFGEITYLLREKSLETHTYTYVSCARGETRPGTTHIQNKNKIKYRQ